MGYVGKYLRDPKFWGRHLGLSALAALNLVDFLTAMLASPGIFRFWVIRLTLLVGMVAGIGAATRHRLEMKSEKETLMSQKLFETRRIQELSAVVARDPEFQTPCYRCRHFNGSNRGCMREIHNLRAKRMRLGTNFYYCLYWESREGDG